MQFQFALPRGERPALLESSQNLTAFQFALPRGERHVRELKMLTTKAFQFALPRGERRKRLRDLGILIGFNSRSRVGSDC